MVEPAAVLLGGEEPERQADDDREEHRRERELDGRREAMLELVGDRAPAWRCSCRGCRARSCSGSPSTARRRAGRGRTGGGSAAIGSGVARSPSSALRGRARQRPDPDEDEDRDPERGSGRAAAAGGRRSGASSRPPAALTLLTLPSETVEKGSLSTTGLGTITLDVLSEGERRLGADVRDHRQELHHLDARLLVERRPLVEVRSPRRPS